METQNQNNKALNITLWVAQILLAAMFIMSGYMKVSTPADELMAKQPGMSESFVYFIRFIGIAELLAALGLVLPSLLRIQPILTGWAAIGLMVIMFSAVILHLSKSEITHAVTCVIIAGVSFFVAWGRMKKAPIAPK